MTIIFVDHQILVNVASYLPSKPAESDEYKDFLDMVRQKVDELEPGGRQVVIMYYFENLEAGCIAAELGLDERIVHQLLRESLKKLKASLAEAVKARWPDRCGNLKLCPICGHPERQAIENIIRAKKPGDNWGTVNKKLKRRIGRTFNPPTIMTNHLKYHDKE